MNPNTIVCIGMMGSGKSSVASILAHKQKWHWIDTDQAIESQENMSITTVFKQKGEPYFRNCEAKWLHQYTSKDPCVISTGGGMVTVDKAPELLKNLGWVVWLYAPVEELAKRMNHGTERPLLNTDQSISSTVSELYRARYQLYVQSCHFIINTCNKTAEEIAQTLLNRWRLLYGNLG